MSIMKSPADGDIAARLLQAAQDDLEHARLTFAELVKRAETGELPGLPDIRKAAQDLRTAGQLLQIERNRVAEQLRKGGGGDAGYALDLDAARLEIGRRLARLRVAREAE